MNVRVLGKNIFVSIFIIDGYYKLFCGKTAELTVTQEVVETSNINTGTSRTYESGMDSAILNVSGITERNNSSGKVSLIYLLQQMKQVFNIQMTLTDRDGNSTAIQFDGILSEARLTKDVTTFSQSFVTFQVSGEIDYDAPIEPTPDSFYLLSDYWTTTAGLDYVPVGSQASVEHSYTLTADDEVLAMAREGDVNFIVSGTPGNLEMMFDISMLRVNVRSTYPFNDGERIFVLFKRPI